MTSLMLKIAFATVLLLSSKAYADEEHYNCFLEYYSLIYNDGSFLKPEPVEEVLKISVKGKKVFTTWRSNTNELQLIDKLGMAQFAAKGGTASMSTLHVWKVSGTEKYEVQWTANWANRVTIFTGKCIME